MARFICAFLIATSAAFSASAAMITNSDTNTVVLIIVEGGKRVEVSIDAGNSEHLCPTGCFMTFPNGDRIGLEGSENVKIVNGSGVVK